MCECSKVFPLDSGIKSFCFLFSLVRLNGKHQKNREIYSLYLELGHEVFASMYLIIAIVESVH